MPIEIAGIARDLVQRTVSAHEIVPGEAGENHGHVILAQAGGSGEVGDENVVFKRVGAGVVSKAAHHPRADDVEGAIDVGPGGIGLCVAAKRSPVGGHAAHDSEAVGLELIDNRQGVLRRARTISEPEAPDGDDRFAAMPLVVTFIVFTRKFQSLVKVFTSVLAGWPEMSYMIAKTRP